MDTCIIFLTHGLTELGEYDHIGHDTRIVQVNKYPKCELWPKFSWKTAIQADREVSLTITRNFNIR